MYMSMDFSTDRDGGKGLIQENCPVFVTGHTVKGQDKIVKVKQEALEVTLTGVRKRVATVVKTRRHNVCDVDL